MKKSFEMCVCKDWEDSEVINCREIAFYNVTLKKPYQILFGAETAEQVSFDLENMSVDVIIGGSQRITRNLQIRIL